jgi:dienelactone hydrolase
LAVNGRLSHDSYDFKAKDRWRLDVNLHGKGATLSEVNFIAAQEPLTPPANPPTFNDNFITLNVYARWNAGYRWAAEVDVFEALKQVQRQYRIDENRVVMRGFSMGGHGAWTLGMHYPDLWCAVAPGAGFTDTFKYLRMTEKPAWYQESLWHIYDAVDYADNCYAVPVVAYGGEIDPQLRATLNMKEALEAKGVQFAQDGLNYRTNEPPFTLLVGPKTGHAFHPDTQKESMRLIANYAEKGRDPNPKRVRFTTWTLKYNRCYWVEIDELEQHYKQAKVDAEFVGANTIRLATQNVVRLKLHLNPSLADFTKPLTLIDEANRTLVVPANRVGRVVMLVRYPGQSWSTHVEDVKTVRKRHNLQGPIEDAFMDSFLVVLPSGEPISDPVAAWSENEWQHLKKGWRLHFRGDAPVKSDKDVTNADIRNNNLILFGDPQSNALLKRIAAKLPIAWDGQSVRVGQNVFDAQTHGVVLIYPNPLNPKRYVVLNSGFTFRESDCRGSNALQTPKLPDWAVVEIGETNRVVAADFFGEKWGLRKQVIKLKT